jgi:hypothetical protein
MDLLLENVDFMLVATFLIPFITGALKWLLERFKVEIRSKILVGMVCGCMSLSYAAIKYFMPLEVFAVFAEISAVTFVAGQGLYKMYEHKNGTMKKT